MHGPVRTSPPLLALVRSGGEGSYLVPHKLVSVPEHSHRHVSELAEALVA